MRHHRGGAPLLTVIVPTRNRPDNLPGQLRLFERESVPVIVADSSDAENAARIRAAMPRFAEYRALAPELTLYDKLEMVLRGVDTPFVLVVSDRKITFPHAVDALLDHLIENEDHVAAMGYIIAFAAHADTIDINRVVWFTPTIADDDPLQRLYHLMQRYQSWAFGAFRTAPLLRAMAQAKRVEGAVFQETLLMNALALQGKMARLPVILTLQSDERSFHLPKRNDPFYWFLDDIRSFFKHYVRYRNALTDFIRDVGIPPPRDGDLDQLVDMVHAVWLHRNFDDGVLNHAARLLLGDAIPPLSAPEVRVPRREPADGDVVKQGALRYIWRSEVLCAEPSEEIRISADEIERVMAQLDVYFGH
jgi:glycosyltransferase domain-containing protein